MSTLLLNLNFIYGICSRIRLQKRRREGALRRASPGKLHIATSHLETWFPPHAQRVRSAHRPASPVLRPRILVTFINGAARCVLTKRFQANSAEERGEVRNVLGINTLEFQPKAFGRIGLCHDPIQADLPLRHQKMNLHSFAFGSASRGFDEDAGSAEVSNMRYIGTTAALPVDPQIPCGRETNRPSPRGNRTDA